MQNKKIAFIALIGLAGAAQAGVIETLDSLNRAYFGVNFDGSIKGYFINSNLSNDGTNTSINSASGPIHDNEAATETNLDINAHPNEYINGVVRLRLHQDWNSGYDEGYNQLIPVWWNLTAQAPEHGLKIQFGDLSVHRSKLELYSVAQDPTAFTPYSLADQEKVAQSYKNVDGVNRHIQGVDVEGNWMLNSDFGIEASAIGARLRTPWWNTAVVNMDNSPTEKWYALTGITAKYDGFFAGFDASWVYDKVTSSRGYQDFSPAIRGQIYASTQTDTSGGYQFVNQLDYEDNHVYLFNAGYKEEGKGKPYKFSARFDYAMSHYELNRDIYMFLDQSMVNGLPMNASSERWMLNPEVATPGKNIVHINSFNQEYYVLNADTTAALYGQLPQIMANVKEGGPLVSLDDKAYLFDADGEYKFDAQNKVNASVKYFHVGQNFVSDMAQSMTYIAADSVHHVSNGVLNNSFHGITSSNLFDGLYDYSWQVNPTTRANNLETNDPLDLKPYQGENNNYRMPYDKNHWTDEMQTYSERQKLTVSDTANYLIQGIYPQGYATPNRQGFDVQASGDVLNGLNATLMYASSAEIAADQTNGFTSTRTYSRLGLGLSADVGKMISLGRPIKIGVGYEMPKVSGAVNLSGKVISAGLDAEVWPNYFVRGSYQQFGFGLTSNDGDETYMGGGLGFRVADGAMLNLEIAKVTVKNFYSQTIPRVTMEMAF